jgi:hypothetical protein
MRVASLAALAVFALACTPTSERSSASRFPTAPLSILNDPAGVDTAAGRLPDLIVDADATAKQWLVRDENLPATFCSVEEGGITPGTHTVLRMTVMTPNIGTADNFVGNPREHMGPQAADGSYPQSDGLFEFAACHNHFHFRHYALYELIDPSTNKVWKAAKKGFCMLDTDPNPTAEGVEPPGPLNYLSCGTKTSDGFQGISHGWTDTYRFFLGGQYFLLDGGDGQPVVPPGQYMIRITVNPPYAPDKKGVCPRVTDWTAKANGDAVYCHQFAELRYDNNVGEALITVPSHPGKTGVGTAINDQSPDGPGGKGTEPVDGN